MTEIEAKRPTVDIDGQPVPLDDCIWLERRPCGCTVAAVIAVVPGAWNITTTTEAFEHFNPTERDRERAARAGRTTEPITGVRYRKEFSARWNCDQHTQHSLFAAEPTPAPGDGRGTMRDRLCDAFTGLIRDNAHRSVIAPGVMADTALGVRDREMGELRAEVEAARQAVTRAEAAAERADADTNHNADLAHNERTRAEKAEAAIERVRRLCDLTISASIRVQAIDQAMDTLAVLAGPDQPADGSGQ